MYIWRSLEHNWAMWICADRAWVGKTLDRQQMNIEQMPWETTHVYMTSVFMTQKSHGWLHKDTQNWAWASVSISKTICITHLHWENHRKQVFMDLKCEQANSMCIYDLLEQKLESWVDITQIEHSPVPKTKLHHIGKHGIIHIPNINMLIQSFTWSSKPIMITCI